MPAVGVLVLLFSTLALEIEMVEARVASVCWRVVPACVANRCSHMMLLHPFPMLLECVNVGEGGGISRYFVGSYP